MFVPILFCLLLIGSFALCAISSALRYLRPLRAQAQLKALGNLFFYRKIHEILFPKRDFDALFVATLCTRHLLLFTFAAVTTEYLLNDTTLFLTPGTPFWILGWLSVLGFIFLSLIFGDLLPRALASRYPSTALKVSSPVASFFLLLSLPFNFLLLKLPNRLSRALSIDSVSEGGKQVTEKIIELLQDTDMRTHLDSNNRKLIESVLNFKDRIVREVMIPRIDVFSLPVTMNIRQVAQVMLDEGYSRVPVFKDNVDHILGILMYKDILSIYMQYEKGEIPSSQLELSIETLLKPAFYIPETKKVSQLLQEFRSKQVHIAIVVDEYGGTEGLVTIEDILEEIVGDISDEYDIQEEELFVSLPTGGWIVDARMSILDIEEKCGIIIPQDGDYETLGGYIYHRAGAIPKSGFRLHSDDFELEIISSNERSVEKVRILPQKLENN